MNMTNPGNTEYRQELDKLVDHFGRCCAQNASWSTSNRTPSPEAREEWSLTNARKALVDAIARHMKTDLTASNAVGRVTLPPLPELRGGGYSAHQLEDMLVAYALAAVELDRQLSNTGTPADFRDIGAHI